MPRHPPIALISLDRSHCQCSSLVGFGIPILLACARRGSKSGHTASSNNVVTFYNHTNPDAIDVFDMSFIAGTPVHCEVISLRPASRDLSGDARSGNIHQHAVRRRPKPSNNKHALSNKLPTYLQSLVCVGSARPSTALTGLGSDAAGNLSITLNTWKPPDISSLHNVCRTGIWPFDRCKLLFLYQDMMSLPPR